MKFIFWPRWGGASFGFHHPARDYNISQALTQARTQLLYGDARRVVIEVNRDGSVGVEAEPFGARLVWGLTGLRHWLHRRKTGTLRSY